MSCWFEDIKKLTLDTLAASAALRHHENPLMNAGALHSDMNLPPGREKSHLNIGICIRNHVMCFNVRGSIQTLSAIETTGTRSIPRFRSPFPA